MNKPLFVVLILGFALNACLPAFLQQPPVASNGTGDAPQVNIQETAAAMAGTMAVQTIAALPTPTLIPPSNGVAGSPTSTITTTIDPNVLVTTTALTSSITRTATTGAAFTATLVTTTQTPTLGSGLITPTVTLHVRYYGTLPPNLPFGFILLSNKSKQEAYISLQCTTKDGYTTILEYPVKGNFGIDAPAGKYTYVAWVGGHKMTGKFNLSIKQELFITLNKDNVRIK
jgi:hypothetical protein